ncbi:MAG: PAS domain S-box protein, partial [Dehalococcoidia bacterium]|nr:PAS domain S-box protein [Dehalococcoidia bacterium]
MAEKRTPSVQRRDLCKQADKKARADTSATAEALSREAVELVAQELRLHQIELEMQNEELRRAQVELEAARARYFDLYVMAPAGYVTLSDKGLIMEANLTVSTLLGVARSALVKKPLSDFIFPEEQDIYYLQREKVFDTGKPQVREMRMVRMDGSLLWVRAEAIKALDADGAPVCRAMVSDITERKEVDTYLAMGREVLQILNEPGGLQASMQHVLSALKTRTGVDALGIRLQDGDDFPYFTQEGFSSDFLQTENTLVERDADGGLCRDKDGNVRLECTCGKIISGKTDPANPHFTKGGSAWKNDKANKPFLDRLTHTRDRCIHDGFQSIALVPIRKKNRIVGLMQLNDWRRGRFTLETVEVLEGIAAHIGAALMRKQAEEALSESELQYRSLFSNMTNGFAYCRMLFDGDNRPVDFIYIEVNDAFERLTGMRKGDVLGKRITEAIPAIKATNPELISIYGEVVVTGKPIAFEVFVEPLGIWLSVSAYTPRRDHFVAVFENITDRRKAEADIRDSERNFRALAENSRQGIAILGRDGRLLYSNRRAMDILGSTRKGLGPLRVQDRLAEGDLARLRTMYRKVMDGKLSSSDRVEATLTRPNGNVTPVEASVSRTTWQGEQSLLIMFKDIGERRRTEQNMQSYVSEVIKAQEAERKRISRDLHDEALQSLCLLSLEMDAEIGKLPYRPDGRMERAKIALDATLEKLRRFCQELRPEILDQLGLVPALRHMASDIAENSSISTRVRVSGLEVRLPTEMETALYRIVQECFSNIRKHSHAKQASVKMLFSDSTVRLTITDDGQGFKVPRDLGDLAGKGRLGLRGMEERARLIGGKLTVSSKAGHGTSVEVEAPMP